MAPATMSTHAAETRTFLLTDIERSTNLLRALGERYETMLARHREILRGATEAYAGEVIDSYADGFFAAFGRAADAVAAAVEGQRLLAAESWPEGAEVRVRMGLHSGSAVRSGDGYVGLDVHKVARVMAAAHGGQILVSKTTAALVADDLSSQVGLLDLGPRRLKDLSWPENLFQVEAAGLRTGFEAPRTLDLRANNLPFQSTPFVGRETELTEAAGLLRKTRLLTLTGAGGTGKTRLALQLAAESIDRFHDGVFVVSLAAVTDPDYLPAAIANELEIRSQGSEDMLRLLQRRLETSLLLLVLDNFEQIVEAATTVTRLLEHCRELKIVVTSREALRVTGEQEYPVRPLGLPDLDNLGPIETLSRFEAVDLFVQRSSAVSPHFTLSEQNARAVAEICVRLDGLPLSIELAAARMKLFTPATLLERLGKRIGVLSGGARDLPERQRTLRNTLDWSFNLLSQDEKRLFVRLGVFVGSFSLAAAEEVCASDKLPALSLTVEDGIESLLNKSLLGRVENDLDGQSRFWMLETIREYAAEILTGSDEESQVRTTHASFFAEIAEQFGRAMWDPAISREEGVRWIRVIAGAHENLNAALEWTTGPGEMRDAFRIVGTLGTFYADQGLRREQATWLNRLVGREDGIEAELRMHVHLANAGAAASVADWPKAREENLLAAKLACEVGDEELEAIAKIRSTWPLVPEEEGIEQRERVIGEVVDSARKAASVAILVNALLTRGELRRANGRFEEAAADFRELLGLNTIWGLHGTLINLGFCEWRLGNTFDAESRFQRVLEQERNGSMSPAVISFALFGLAAVSADPVRALRLLSASDSIRARFGLTQIFDHADQADYDIIAERLKSDLAADEYECVREEGERMKMEAAVEYALSGTPDCENAPADWEQAAADGD